MPVLSSDSMRAGRATDLPAAGQDLSQLNLESKRNPFPRTCNVALLGSAITAVSAGLTSTVQAATAIFDRLQFVGPTSEVTRTTFGDGLGATPVISGSQFTLTQTTSISQYSAVVSSLSGDPFTFSNGIGFTSLNIYQFDSGTNTYNRLHSINGGVLSDNTQTNFYGDDLQNLTWDISGINLNPGTYVFAPYQQTVGNDFLFINFTAPGAGGLGLNDWSAVLSETPNSAQVTFQDYPTYTGFTPGTGHFADRLMGTSVPEPAMPLLIMVGVLAAMFQRRR